MGKKANSFFFNVSWQLIFCLSSLLARKKPMFPEKGSLYSSCVSNIVITGYLLNPSLQWDPSISGCWHSACNCIALSICEALFPAVGSAELEELPETQISQLTREKRIFSSNAYKTALFIGKVDREKFKMETIKLPCSREKSLLRSTRGKVWAASKMRREMQIPSEIFQGKIKGEHLGVKIGKAPRVGLPFLVKAWECLILGNEGHCPLPHLSPGHLAQLTWFSFSHNLLFSKTSYIF